MTQFEFVLVFISIIAAFAVSDILASWGEQIRLRRVARHYWLHTAWSALLLFVTVQVWWSLWDLNDSGDWTFVQYLGLVVPFFTLALMAYILTPNLDDTDRDIKHHYFDISRWFFSLAALYLVSWAAYSHGVLGRPLDEPGSLYRVAGIALMLALAIWPNERLHACLAVLAYVLMAAWLTVVVL